MVDSAISDLDECSYGMTNCTDNAECIDIVEGFTCQCSAGFTGEGSIQCSSKKTLHIVKMYATCESFVTEYILITNCMYVPKRLTLYKIAGWLGMQMLSD